MRYESVKTLVRSAAIALPALLGTGYASAQTTVALTAQPATATMPDGNSVPMWSFCQSAAVGTPGSSTGTCPTAGGPWTPGPTIVVPTDSTGFGSLTITLTNNLKASTSIVILGQLGGGLGTGGALPTDVPRMDLPAPHSGQPAITWPAVNTAATFVPPAQGSRARAFGPETSAGGSATYSWAKLRPGTYLYESGSVPSLQVPMGLYGVIIVTQPPTDTAAGVAYPTAASAAGTPTATNVPYDADVALLFSEIDPRQNAAVDAAATDGISELVLFNDPSCTLAGTAGTHHCYPPAVNYAPTYFMINGQAYDPSAPAMSGFALPGNTILKNGGQVLLRLLNAGSRTHVPTVIGVPSLSIVAEDGNLAPGVPKAQSHILMPASKTFDAVMAPPQTTPATSPASYAIASYPIFDRALSLTSGNLDKQTVVPNSGMLGFIAVQPANSIIGSATGAAVPTALLATANNDAFATAINTAFNGNVIANDLNVVNAALSSNVSNGTLVLNADGSFIYTPASDFFGTDNFTYTGNPNSATPTAPAMVTITVGVDPTKGAPTAANATFTSKVASVFKSGAPGVLANDTDPAKLGLTAWLDDVGTCSSVDLKTDGSFTAVPSTAGLSCTFHYHAKNSLGGVSASKDATVNFTPGTGLVVRVQDTQDPTITVPDYSWVIEEDTTYFHDPANPSAVNTLATNFHKSFMPVLASGCTGSASCGDVQTVGGIPAPARARSLPSDVVLDPTKRYFISILPGDADQGSAAYNADGTFSVTSFGHSVGGVSIPAAIPAVGAANPAAQVAATVLVPRNPLPPAQLTVYVFEDNNPTNGGVDDNEPGLGGFTINIFDTRGSSGDPAGQMTYDLSGMPLTNSLANQTDSVTHVNLCPINGPSGTIITCPALDSRGQPSPLAGLANIKNFIPGRFDVWAHPGVERSAKGENWIQVSTLEGTHANDTFIKAGEPPYWQEFGPPGFHSFIGFVNPAHIASVNKAQHGTATVNGRVPSLHMDRPRPAMSNLNDSCATAMKPDNTPVNPQDPSCRATLASTTCYVAVNSSAGTGATVAMATCDAYGNFSLKNVPAGEHELVIWDQWLDQIIAYKALTVLPSASPSIVNAGDIPVFSWFTSVAQSAFIDLNQNGVKDVGEPGVSQVPMNIRFRDGSISNFLTTDNSGSVTASEVFPLFNWYVLESDTTRYTGTGVSVTYDAGGQPDTATTSIVDLNGAAQTKDYRGLLNSAEANPLDASLLPAGSKATPNSTMRIDPGTTLTEGVQSYINQTSVVDWGKRPYVPGETGGIMGLVFYAATRGFDDPSLEVQFSWEPAVARVPVNLYQEVANADGSVSRILVDQTTTWSWDDSTASMHCPGEPAFDITNTNPTGDPFVNVTLAQSVAQATTNDPTVTAAAGATARTKCYDGQHSFNQVQPAVYDGRYRFPTANCTICVANPANTGLPQKPASVVYPKVLPAGKYVVEVVVPSGYEIVKEEDKNILIGDSWIAPFANTQFMGVGNIFIVPDQATLNDANVLGGNLRRAFPPCVGPIHRVPDYLSLFPDSSQVAPFAGQDRPLCDHKEVVLADQMQTSADFQLFTQAPIAGHITGIMLNDAAAEFDPYNPAFLEKASLPNAPISIKNYNGTEIARVYNDRYGTFNNLVPSSWQANVPDPSGFGANMLTYCMNDPGPIPDPSGQIDPSTITAANPNGSVRMITDPMYNPMFSNFCYNWPTLAGITTYLDTPVLPVSAYASASTYEPVDCAYPNNTPAIFRVDGTEIGPFIDSHNATRTLTITALGDVQVLNPAYEGPNAAPTAAAPTINQPKIKRHYGFGAAPGSVTIGGVSVPVTAAGWSDGKITLTVPATGVATGQLVVTTANGQQTIDSITVTIDDSTRRGYRAPVHVSPAVAGTSSDTGLAHPIQDAIDAANAGDLIILDSGNYPELVIMDRPVRLQGVGAAAVVINATKFPNQKVDQWRTRINNLFGLDNQGNALPGTAGTYPPVDPLPGQEITGGVVLLEPSVLSTEEGAGITVLAKGYKRNGQPLGTSRTDCANVGNFLCAASRIDGVSVTGGDAGGGIYVNGWAHNLEISNNRVYGNAGPFAGGVRIGQPYLEGQTLPAEDSFDGFGYDLNVKIHNNAITNNGTVEGNAAAGAPAAAAGGAGGGLSICAGSDGYKVTGNWICGNFTSSDGGGIGHIGLSQNGLIQNNKILFNESYNQTGPQSGGGLIIEGEGATGTTLTLGSGNVRVDSNLILGNFARAGSGGGIRLQSVNGADAATEGQRWKVTVTNNMIVNNLAAWAGAGVSLADTLFSSVVNNTIASNDSTGIAGNLFNTQVGTLNTGSTTAVPNPAGISSELTSAPLLARLPSRLRTANTISDPHLVNDIVWHNRSFFFTMASGSALLSPSNKWTDAVATTKPALGAPAANGCTGTDAYWDVGVVGDTSAATPSIPGFAVGNTVLSTTVGTPNITQPYCNASRTLPGRQFEPGTPFQPPFGINVSATLDESGNFVDLHFGPLSLMDQATGTAINGDYHLAGQSGNAYNSGVVPPASASLAVAHDFDGDPRPQALIYDIGADEFLVPSPKASVSANSLGFGSVLLNASKTLTFTLSNKGTAALTIGSIALSGPRAASYTSTNDCAGAVAINGSCTITVNFTPTALGAAAATLTITDNDPLTSPTLIGLSGTGIAGFTLSPQSPPTVNFGQVRIGNRATFDINVTNNTAASLTNLKASYGTPGASADFASMPAGTTCGTTLLAGASCRFAVAFTPKTGQSGSTQNVTMTVSGVQGSTAVSLTDALVGTVK